MKVLLKLRIWIVGLDFSLSLWVTGTGLTIGTSAGSVSLISPCLCHFANIKHFYLNVFRQSLSSSLRVVLTFFPASYKIWWRRNVVSWRERERERRALIWHEKDKLKVTAVLQVTEGLHTPPACCSSVVASPSQSPSHFPSHLPDWPSRLNISPGRHKVDSISLCMSLSSIDCRLAAQPSRSTVEWYPSRTKVHKTLFSLQNFHNPPPESFQNTFQSKLRFTFFDFFRFVLLIFKPSHFL